MLNLFLRSALVLALLFGLLFAVGMGVVVYFDLPSVVAVVFAVGILLLQYILGPFILQLIYKIEWREAKSLDPELKVRDVLKEFDLLTIDENVKTSEVVQDQYRI